MQGISLRSKRAANEPKRPRNGREISLFVFEHRRFFSIVDCHIVLRCPTVVLGLFRIVLAHFFSVLLREGLPLTKRLKK